MKTWDERASDVIAQGCLTYSKRSDQYVKGVFPTHLVEGHDCYVTDTEGKTYVDWCGGLGSNLLDCTNNLSLPTVYEVELAEKVRERIPVCEKLRVLKTGTDACLAAVRIARAYAENTKWCSKGEAMGIGMGYHGFGNQFIACEKPGSGTVYEKYDKLETLNQVVDAISIGGNVYDYCIIEPVQLDCSLATEVKLRELRELCTEQKIVLIFDEVITGFRTPDYCMSNYLGVHPDIICMGKALGSGYPLSIVGGKKEIMNTPGWFVSSTFAGEMSSIKKALEVIDFLTPQKLQDLWIFGSWFQRSFNAITPKLQLKGIPTKAVFVGDELYKNLFWQEMCKRGYLFFKAWHVTFAHTMEVMVNTLKVAKEVIREIDDGKVQLEGTIATEVFKRYEDKNEQKNA